MNLISAALLGIAAATVKPSDDRKNLKFVFEINRHGARGSMPIPGDDSFGK
jgi:hypothetical protein